MAGPLRSLQRGLRSLSTNLRLELFRDLWRQYPLFCFIILTLTTLTLLLHRYLHVLMIFWSFVGGAVTFFCSVNPDALFPSVFPTSKARPMRREPELFPFGHSCAVCGKNKCNRHRPTLLLENHQPWLDLKLSSKVDASITEVFELVLENFVFPWYRDISDDEDCVDEIRMSFRFFSSVLVRRAQKVDIPAVFSDKVMKAAMKHIQVIVAARDRGGDLQASALAELGSELHVALRSRRDELQYLRTLTQLLFPYVMPPKATDCRSLSLLIREVMAGSVFLPTMDFMADPDTVNLMVLLFVDDSPPEEPSEPPSALVPFLHRYSPVYSKRPTVLKLELKQIREQQDLLFRFMNFLKQEGAVHVLQFCLTVEEFNDRILQPELSDSQLRLLHSEVVQMFQTYCVDDSRDQISFDRFILNDIRDVAEGPYQEVVRLQKMRCLFEAYEHVLSLLENVFTPMFCHSDEYFRHLLKGVESPARNSKINRNSCRRGEASGISRIGSRIKGVFKSSALEGAMLPPTALGEDDDTVEEATVVQEEDFTSEPQSWSGSWSGSGSGSGRNLSEWSVWIPFIDVMEDETRKERVPAFLIEVHRHDRRGVGHDAESWCVCRRYLEFYVLESKLTEFHGSFSEVQLPNKRILGPKNYDFLESKRPEFEEYLQRLLLLPELSNSQLLADFLSPHSMESQFTDKILPDVNLGKIFKSVPGKLMKEKGQNLEPFLQSFFNSCESAKPKPSRNELTIVSPTAQIDKKLFSELYKNNAEFVTSDLGHRKSPQTHFLSLQRLDGLFDAMMFLARTVFRVSEGVHHFLSALRIVGKRSFEAHLQNLMKSRLERTLQEHRVVSLITQLRDAVFCEGSVDRTPEEKQLRAKRTFEEMMNYIPDFVGKLIGEESQYEGVRLLFDSIQQPLLNKQMTYVLLDIAVQELFPELRMGAVGETFVV